jgi:isocitrate/isopropylmalate dehydrogenase
MIPEIGSAGSRRGSFIRAALDVRHAFEFAKARGLRKVWMADKSNGIAALDVFSEWKSIYVDFSGRLQRAQLDVS